MFILLENKRQCPWNCQGAFVLTYVKCTLPIDRVAVLVS